MTKVRHKETAPAAAANGWSDRGNVSRRQRLSGEIYSFMEGQGETAINNKIDVGHPEQGAV